MSFSEILSISKLPGLYQIHKQRTDGLIVKSLQDDKVFFAASRAHVFTPLENITIYTDTEPMELVNVFRAIQKSDAKSIPSAKDDNEKLKSFFAEVVPTYDAEKVYVSDIQKIIKWYALLEDKKLIPAEGEENKSDEEGKKQEVKSEKKLVADKSKTNTNVKSGSANSKPKAKINNTPRKTS